MNVNIKKICITCKNHINENKEIEANLYPTKRRAPNEFGQMLP